MRVTSFMRYRGELAPIDVEVSLAPGLPQISFLGLPDAAIRESVLRVKAALRRQGFEPPSTQQVLVHLRPSHIRKTSRGLDLAVAAAFLWETNQIPRGRWEQACPFVYGELSLEGEIFRPDDLQDAETAGPTQAVLTGPGDPHPLLTTYVAHCLRNLSELIVVPPADSGPRPKRPKPPRSHWPSEAALLLAAVAAGEHACVIAGPPGSGKTAVAEALGAFVNPPSQEEFRQSQKWSALAGGDRLQWRPIVQPHHSITPLAMIGGGVPPAPGEITRAHGGVLILDELLEFKPAVQDALREPLESGVIRLARSRAARSFPARFSMIATTNLCPCGKWDPFADLSQCVCAQLRRTRYIAKLSGPFLDRAQILAFTSSWMGEAKAAWRSSEWALEKIAVATSRRKARGQSLPNGRAPLEALAKYVTPFEDEQILSRREGSSRRTAAILRVARTLADLEDSEAIAPEHWSQSLRWAACSFERLLASR